MSAFLNVENSLTGRRWVGPEDSLVRQAEALAQAADLPLPVARVLAERGVDPSDVAGFLSPTLREMLPDPLREWLDRQDETARRGALQTLKRVDRESGWANAVEAMLARLSLPDGGGVLGPITISGAGGPGTPVPAALLGDDSELVRAIVRVPRGQGRALALALKEAVAVRGARRETGHVHVQMDVAELV